MIRFGLCCLFKNQDIKFRRITAKSALSNTRKERDKKISDICLQNVLQLYNALRKCDELNIKAFRILSPLLPLYTHPQCGYKLNELICSDEIYAYFSEIKKFSSKKGIRTSFHPDQFILLSSPDRNIVDNSINDLNYHAELAELIGSDVINIHAGGAYGNKKETLKRLLKNLESSSLHNIKRYLTFENDDRIYTPEDILKISEHTGLPFVYDVHHHRCNPDSLSIEEATNASMRTWEKSNREPLFHISSPKEGWNSKRPQMHSDYIDIKDFPEEWLKLKNNITLDIEAKSKELAVLKLHAEIKEKFDMKIGLG